MHTYEGWFVAWGIFVLVMGVFSCVSFGRLVYSTNEDSVSALIARRFHREAFATIILLCVFCSAASATVIICACLQSPDINVSPAWYVLGSIGPPLILGILLFPLLVHRPSKVLGFTPFPAPPAVCDRALVMQAKGPPVQDAAAAHDPEEGRTLIPYEELEPKDFVRLKDANGSQLNPDRYQSVGVPVHELMPENDGYARYQECPTVPKSALRLHRSLPIKLILDSPDWSTRLHFLFVGAGCLASLTSSFGYGFAQLQEGEANMKTTFVTLLLATLGIVLLVGFIGITCWPVKGHQQFRTLIEGFGVIVTLVSVLLWSVTSTSITTGRPSILSSNYESYLRGWFAWVIFESLLTGAIFFQQVWTSGEESISGFMACRFRRGPYFLCIMAAISATSLLATIVLCAITAHHTSDNYVGLMVLAAIAPLCLLIILFVPIIVNRPVPLLGFIPNSWEPHGWCILQSHKRGPNKYVLHLSHHEAIVKLEGIASPTPALVRTAGSGTEPTQPCLTEEMDDRATRQLFARSNCGVPVWEIPAPRGSRQFVYTGTTNPGQGALTAWPSFPIYLLSRRPLASAVARYTLLFVGCACAAASCFDYYDWQRSVKFASSAATAAFVIAIIGAFGIFGFGALSVFLRYYKTFPRVFGFRLPRVAIFFECIGLVCLHLSLCITAFSSSKLFFDFNRCIDNDDICVIPS